jgi:hypothetical protein
MCIKLKSIPFPAFQVNSYGKQQISSKNFASATIESLTRWLLLSTASWFHWCLWFFFFLKRSYKGLVRSCQGLKSKPKNSTHSRELKRVLEATIWRSWTRSSVLICWRQTGFGVFQRDYTCSNHHKSGGIKLRERWIIYCRTPLSSRVHATE